MSLFTKADPLVPALTATQFMARHKTGAVFATESISTFLGQIKDTALNLANMVTLQSPDKVVFDAVSTKHRTLAKAKETSFANFKHVIISKPESFNGLYVDYLKDLTDAAISVSAMTDEATERLRMVLATFINEYSDERAESIYGYHKFKDEEKRLEKVKKEMASYFTASSNKSKTNPSDVLRSFADLEKIYEQLRNLNDVLSEARLKKIDKDSRGLVEMVDLLIEHNIQSGVLVKNNTAKKELMECIHTTAQLIEFYNALFAQLMFFCGSFKALTEALNDF